MFCRLQFTLLYNSSEALKKRLNRRLCKIAKWVDCSAEDRQIEFRNVRSATFGPPNFALRAGVPPHLQMTAGVRLPGQLLYPMAAPTAPQHTMLPNHPNAILNRTFTSVTASSSSSGGVAPYPNTSTNTFVRAGTAPPAPTLSVSSAPVSVPVQSTLPVVHTHVVHHTPAAQAVEESGVEVVTVNANEPSLTQSLANSSISPSDPPSGVSE